MTDRQTHRDTQRDTHTETETERDRDRESATLNDKYRVNITSKNARKICIGSVVSGY